MLSFTLNPALRKQLQETHNLCIQAYATLNQLTPETRAYIEKHARISTLGASTRIENALLTNPEIDWIDTVLMTSSKHTAFAENQALIKNKFAKDRERSIEEVAGCRQMLLHIYQQAEHMKPLKEIDIRALHSELMQPYLKESPYVGHYKIQPNSVVETNQLTGATREVFKTADPGVITQVAMHELMTWYNQAINNQAGSLPVICEWVYRFLAIHPFQDGNGRLGRGLFLLALLQSHEIYLPYLARYLSIDRQIEKHKEEYYFVLNACSNGQYCQEPSNYKIDIFLGFMLKMITRALDDITVYQQRYDTTQTLSDNALAVLTCFKEHPEIRLTTKMLLEYTHLPRRTLIYQLTLLTQKGLIQRYGTASTARYQLVF